jgi:hypothetical protein
MVFDVNFEKIIQKYLQQALRVIGNSLNQNNFPVHQKNPGTCFLKTEIFSQARISEHEKVSCPRFFEKPTIFY